MPLSDADLSDSIIRRLGWLALLVALRKLRARYPESGLDAGRK